MIPIIRSFVDEEGTIYWATPEDCALYIHYIIAPKRERALLWYAEHIKKPIHLWLGNPDTEQPVVRN